MNATLTRAATTLAPLLYNPDAPVIDRFSGQWAFLANPYPAITVIDGMTFPSSEHAYNALKTLDLEQRALVRDQRNWRDAKRIGQTVDLRVPLAEWDRAVRFEVMDQVLRAKFLCDPRRMQALVSTGSSLLIEGNRWHDQGFGDCRCGRPACAEPGVNGLGRLLMALRAEIRAMPRR